MFDEELQRKLDGGEIVLGSCCVSGDDPTFAVELTKTNIQDWAEESVEVCRKTVYRNLDPEITSFADMPLGYEADAKRVPRRRAALAGYRLADELKRITHSD
jgi:hypothetical protein